MTAPTLSRAVELDAAHRRVCPVCPQRVAPSQVADTDEIRLIGMAVPGRVLWTRNAGWSDVWGCDVWEIAVRGAPELLRQPETLPVEVYR